MRLRACLFQGPRPLAALLCKQHNNQTPATQVAFGLSAVSPSRRFDNVTSSRMQPYVLVSTLTVVAALAIVTRADAKPPHQHPVKHRQQLEDLAGDIAVAQTSLWQCQDWMMWPRSYPAQTPWQLPG